ncbi:RHS repeat-associated core domain-containing protein [Pseudomonas sp. NPDC089422]|uniref:RHS repeat-associated core domain-containing protein n=1 Tax=Pseudomonas sp. NPDC089422 TaxID=3364466 RepID=UPI00382BB117
MLNLNGARKSRLQNELMARAFGVQGQRGHFCYGPYGYQTANQAQTLLRFNGQCLEPMSQGYLLGNGHRLYQPRLFRFHSPDALSPFGDGGFNCYAYCSGDPINKIDPSGRKGTGLSALIAKHSLDKKYAKQALKGMAIPDSETHVQTQRFINSDDRIFMVFRNNKGRFSAIAQPDPENVKLKLVIEQQLKSISITSEMDLFKTSHPLVHRNLLSGGEVMGADMFSPAPDSSPPPPPPLPPRTDRVARARTHLRQQPV